MAIITLTTDMGTRDYYVGAVKGALLSKLPGANIVDITHDVVQNGMVMAGFIIKNAYPNFPAGTIHIVAVDTNAGLESRHIVFEHHGHFFVGTDNGLFSLCFDDMPPAVYDITHPQNYSATFPALSLFTSVAQDLFNGKRPEDIGKPAIGLVEKKLFRATIEPDAIVGTIIYIDGFGNAVSNIDRALIEQVRNGRAFQILVRSTGYKIRKVSRNYNEVPEGELVAVLNHAGYIELAIHAGNIASLLGLDIGSSVRIEFL